MQVHWELEAYRTLRALFSASCKLHRLGCFLLPGAGPHSPQAELASRTVREEPLPSPVYYEATRLPGVQEAIKQPCDAGDLRKPV